MPNLFQHATASDSETFDFGLGAVPPLRQSNNRHVVGEPYATIDGQTYYPCNFRLFGSDPIVNTAYFQCLMTLAQYDALDAITFRDRFIPKCHLSAL